MLLQRSSQTMGPRLDLLLLFSFTVAVLFTPALSDLVLSKVERRIDLISQIVRSTSTLKVENTGKDSVSEVLLVIPERQVAKLAYLIALSNVGKGKAKRPSVNLLVKEATFEGIPPALVGYSVSLPEPLGNGQSFTLDLVAGYTHLVQPFPEKITQADIQLMLYEDSAYYISPYEVKAQTLTIKLPRVRLESYTKLENSQVQGSDIKYGPYENRPPFSSSPIIVHFESKFPFAVAKELVREIEISHWGNVQVTEHYNIVNKGSEVKGEFSRLDFQARPVVRAPTAFRFLLAKLPPRAHSVYYRDEIGNISTSHLWSDSKKTQLEIEPRYPLFGGWKTTFTIGYSLPLKDFLFQSEGKRFLNFSFGSPISELVIDTLIVKVVLPEGSRDISVSAPFVVKESQEVKFSHLDFFGRPVVVLEKNNVVPEHNQNFQVYYKFSSISMLMEPLMLISGIFFLFITCIVYVHADMSISKSSPSYLAKLQWEEVRSVIQQVENIMNRCLAVHEKLEASLRDLSRTGDVQACKAARKSADAALKELSKDLKPLISSLQSSHQASHILPKVDELVNKEKELQEKILLKHSSVVDCYEKKVSGREIENRIAAQQQKITALRQEVDDLVEYIAEL